MAEFNQYNQVKFITEEYRKLIDAQGWLVKWERAISCTCYDESIGGPDYRCDHCKGRGYTFDKPDDILIKEEKVKVVDVNKIKLRNNPSRVDKIFNPANNMYYGVSSIDDNIVTVTPATLKDYNGIFVDYEYSIASSVVEYLNVNPNNKDEIIVSNKYLQSVISVKNVATNDMYTPDFFTDEMIKLPQELQDTDELEVEYTYVDPIKMIITDAKEQRSFRPIGEFIEGDIMLTFMYQFHIGERDKITIIDNDVSTRYNDLLTKGEHDRLKLDHVIKIIEVRDNNTKYVEGTDFKFVGTRGIEWIPGGNSPVDGEKYSVIYLARREYVVWGEIWQERHHGGILLPRRLMARKLEKINEVIDASFDEEI